MGLRSDGYLLCLLYKLLYPTPEMGWGNRYCDAISNKKLAFHSVRGTQRSQHRVAGLSGSRLATTTMYSESSDPQEHVEVNIHVFLTNYIKATISETTILVGSTRLPKKITGPYKYSTINL